MRLVVNIKQPNQLRASSWNHLPVPLRGKQACINVKNVTDHHCFKWAILSALHPRWNKPSDVKSYKSFEQELNFKEIDFPVSLKDITKFEKQNPISINVYMHRKYGENYRVNP